MHKVKSYCTYFKVDAKIKELAVIFFIIIISIPSCTEKYRCANTFEYSYVKIL